MSDFADAKDVIDFAHPLIADMARQLGEPTLPQHVHAYLSTEEDGAVELGQAPVSRYGSSIPHMTMEGLRRMIVIDCVAVARHLRRNRSVHRFTDTGHQPAWSCHTSILTLAMMRLGGHGHAILKALGPGTLRPRPTSRMLTPQTVRGHPSPSGTLVIDSHQVLDGRVSIHATHTGRPSFHTRDGNEVAIVVKDAIVPETVAASHTGMPLSQVIDGPVADLLPDLPVIRIENDRGLLKIFVADHRMPIAPAPVGADMSFVELGNEQLASLPAEDSFPIRFDPVTLLPYDPSMHLSNP